MFVIGTIGKDRAKYNKYFKEYLDGLDDDQLISFVNELNEFLDARDRERGVADSVMGERRNRFGAHTAVLSESDSADRTKIYTLIGTIMSVNNVVFFDKPEDQNKYKITAPKMLKVFTKLHRLNVASEAFVEKCKGLEGKNESLKSDPNFSNALDKFTTSSKQFTATKFDDPQEANRVFKEIVRAANEINTILNKKKIKDREFDLALIAMIYALNVFSFTSYTYAAAITLKYILANLKTLGRSAAIAALRKVGSGTYYAGAVVGAGLVTGATLVGKGAAMTGKGAYRATKATGAALAGGAAILVGGTVLGAQKAGRAAARKVGRLANQERLSDVFWQEVGRFDKRLEASKIWGEARSTLKSGPTRFGTHVENFLNLAGVVVGGFALGLYIPAKISVGMLNERYSLINQVKLGVTGSRIGDKKKNTGFKIPEDQNTKNNTELVVSTDNYVEDRTGAIIAIQKINKVYEVLLVASSKEDCEKILRLLCDAVKSSDGKKITIDTRDPTAEHELEVIGKIKSLYPGIAIDIKVHGTLGPHAGV